MATPFRPALTLLTQYAEYHRDRRNIATHFIGVPMIVFGVLAMLTRPAFEVAGLTLTAAWLVYAIGATVFVLAQSYLQKLMGLASKATEGMPLLPDLLHPDRWLLILGMLFVLSVYFFPTGIVGRLRGSAKMI